MATFGTVDSSTALDREISIAARQLRKGSTAPTDITTGTTPTIGALRFDAVAETASGSIALPANMDKTVDPQIILISALNVGETNNDVLSWSLDYTATIENSTGSGVAKTSTNLTATTTVTTANGLAAGDVYTTTFTIDAGDATNPLASAIGLYYQINLTNITGVAAIRLLNLVFKYRGTY